MFLSSQASCICVLTALTVLCAGSRCRRARIPAHGYTFEPLLLLAGWRSICLCEDEIVGAKPLTEFDLVPVVRA
jgi:hypothetical protein